MGRNRNIAVVIDIDWPEKHHYEVIGGIQRYARERGDWNLAIDLFPERALKRYDAAIGRITPELARAAIRKAIPLVNTWFGSPVADRLPTVCPDIDAIARMAADHLIARGFRQFAYLGLAQKFSRALRDSTRAYLRESGYRCSSLLISDRYNTGAKPWARFSDALENWVDTWSGPLGVFCEDVLGRWLTFVCRHKGVPIPQEAAIIGFWNEPDICLLAEPTLTSIDVGHERIGFRAAELLGELLDGKPPPRRMILSPPSVLVPRQSTDAYAVDDPCMAEALRFIAEHGHEGIKVSDVARGANVTRRTLERRFAEHGGRSVSQEIVRFRLERLKRLLIQTDKPAKSLAYEVGFRDANRMYETFSKFEHTTPSAYRKAHGVIANNRRGRRGAE